MPRPVRGRGIGWGGAAMEGLWGGGLVLGVLRDGGDALLHAGARLRRRGAAGLDDVLDLRGHELGVLDDERAADIDAGLLELALQLVAALAQLALDARARLLGVALDALEGGRAAALEAAQLRLGLGARRVLAAQVVDDVDDEVAGDQGRADRDVDGLLGVLGRAADGALGLGLGLGGLLGGLRLGARGGRLGLAGRRLASGRAAVRGARRGSLLGGGRALRGVGLAGSGRLLGGL